MLLILFPVTPENVSVELNYVYPDIFSAAGDIIAEGIVAENGDAILDSVLMVSSIGTVAAKGSGAKGLLGVQSTVNISSISASGAATKTVLGVLSAINTNAMPAKGDGRTGLASLTTSATAGVLQAIGSISTAINLTGNSIASGVGTIVAVSNAGGAATLNGLQLNSTPNNIAVAGAANSTLLGAIRSTSAGSTTQSAGGSFILSGTLYSSSIGSLAPNSSANVALGLTSLSLQIGNVGTTANASTPILNTGVSISSGNTIGKGTAAINVSGATSFTGIAPISAGISSIVGLVGTSSNITLSVLVPKGAASTVLTTVTASVEAGSLAESASGTTNLLGKYGTATLGSMSLEATSNRDIDTTPTLNTAVGEIVVGVVEPNGEVSLFGLHTVTSLGAIGSNAEGNIYLLGGLVISSEGILSVLANVPAPTPRSNQSVFIETQSNSRVYTKQSCSTPFTEVSSGSVYTVNTTSFIELI